MTEEIIIDGVNVAGCAHLVTVTLGEPPFCRLDYFTCEGETCYYKQLKRLEQECDELKKACEKCKLFDIEKTNRDLLERIDKLEQENKELKEKIIELSEEKGHLIVENNTLKESNQSLSMLGTDLVSANETVRKEFFRADKNKDMWREKAENYRSALGEIEVIADDTFKVCDDDCGNARKIKLIIDRINECLGG